MNYQTLIIKIYKLKADFQTIYRYLQFQFAFHYYFNTNLLQIALIIDFITYFTATLSNFHLLYINSIKLLLLLTLINHFI